MRILLSTAIVLLVAACGPTPPPATITAPPAAQKGTSLVGLNAAELAAWLGQPILTIREGQSVKLQYRSGTCVLDAYLYPPANGAGSARVTHVDTRSREGTAIAESACRTAIEAR